MLAICRKVEVGVLKMSMRMRILAVDDDPALLLVLGTMMHQLGYAAPLTATSGQHALAMLADPTSVIDCVALDIQMPEMDGIETCRRIRAISGHQHTPIMMVTALSSRNSIDSAFAAGATDYLVKPLEKIELRARMGMLQRLVEERRRARSLQSELDSLWDLPGLCFGFDDPVVLPQSEMLIDYLALQNHLLTLNRLSLHSVAAIGFRVVGASLMYKCLAPVDYLDYLSYIGGSIATALKRHRFLLAHAGRGEFVAVLNQPSAIDQAEIELEVASQISGEAGVYGVSGLSLPVVRAGTPQRNRVFHRTVASTMLDRARLSAHEGQSAHVSLMTA